MKTLLSLVVVLVVGLAFGYSFSLEQPVGRIRGKVLLVENKRPLRGVKVILTREDEVNPEDQAEFMPGTRDLSGYVRRTVTDKDGDWGLEGIPTGSYRVTAYSRSHSVSDTIVYVNEDEVSTETLTLNRSQPELQLTQQQRVFSTKEQPFLPMHGYVDGKIPAGRDKLDLRIYQAHLTDILSNQVTARALQRIGDRWEGVPRLPKELLHPKTGPAPRLVSTSSTTITGADTEGFYHQRVKVPIRGAGLYLAEVRHGQQTACTWLQISDTGLVIKRTPQAVLAFAVDMESGLPRAATQVALYRDGKSLAKAMTDQRGLASFALAVGQPSHLLAIALRGGDEDAVSDEYYSDEETGQWTSYTYTDRPIYRPGARIQYKTILRHDAESDTRYTVPGGEEVQVELRDPSGNSLLRQKRTVNKNGSISGYADLSNEAPTGAYTFVTSIRGEQHTQDVTVASYRKPEFFVTVIPESKRFTTGEQASVIISGEYYFGAPVAGAKVEYEVYSDTDWAAEFPDDYGLDEWDTSGDDLNDEYGYGYGESIASGTAKLDENGKANIAFPTISDKAEPGEIYPQSRTFRVNVTVTDGAGRMVVGDGSARVTSGDFHLGLDPDGYVLTPREDKSIDIQARDYDGKPAANKAILVESGYSRWNEEEQESHFQPIRTYRATTDAAGRASVKVRAPHSGELQLIAHAQDDSGHKIQARTEVWATSESADYDSDYPDLSVLTDKRHYEAGETAKILLNTRETGQTALVTVEGDRIYRSMLVPLTHKSTFFSLPLPGDYGPNVYLSACYVKHKKFAQSSIPLRVHSPQREIKVAIDYDRYKHMPGEEIAYRVKTTDTAGKPVSCDLSFGVVDESIYALREDSPKDLNDTFYPRRSNRVQTSFSFEPQYLGDADKGEPKIETRKKFLDTAFWQPNIQTGPDGRAVVKFRLPDNLTTWRATAIAQSARSSFGFGTKKVVVTKDFGVRLEAPRFFTEKDQTRLMVMLHNETKLPQTATVRLAASGINLRQSNDQTVTVNPGETAQASWPIIAGGASEARIRLTAWTGAGKGQLTDGLETSIPIRAHGRLQITDKVGEVRTGQISKIALNFNKNALPGSKRVTVRVLPSPLSVLRDSMEYLMGYPYGCVEQTLSRFLPDILLRRLFRFSSLNDKELKALQKRVSPMVKDSLTRLYNFQHESGAWGWWETDEDNPEMTAYVLYGLSLAKEEGFAVHPIVYAQGRRAAALMVPKAKGRDKVFLLYALAVAGDMHNARAGRKLINLAGWRGDKNKIVPWDTQALAWLALLDKRLGSKDTASFTALSKRAVEDAAEIHWSTGDTQDGELWDSRTATASAMQAMLAHSPNDPRIGKSLRWLMFNRTGDYWESTLDTSFVISALTEYLRVNPDAVKNTGEVEMKLNGAPLRTVRVGDVAGKDAEFVFDVPASRMKPGTNEITFERNGGSSPVYYTAMLRQTVVEDEMQPIAIGGLRVQRDYLRLDSKREKDGYSSLHASPTNNQFNQGDRVRVRLTIDAPRDLQYVLIEDPYNAGCEVTERGTAETMGDEEWGEWWTNTDVRDDRIAFFARNLSKGRHTIEYNLRAQTPGTYRTLPTLVQAMYAPATRAESGETTIRIQ